MPIDDEKLDAMLRDMSVPQDLKATLLEIPEGDANVAVVPNRSRLRVAIVGTLLAIAATVLVFMYITPADVASVDPDNGDVLNAKLLLIDMERNHAAIEEILKAQTVFSNSRIRLNTEPIFEPDATVALTLSMAAQSSLDHGADFESVRAKLESVVSHYPNTLGAEQARDLLQIN